MNIQGTIARFFERFVKTGLEQNLNTGEITTELMVPEIKAAARKMAADGIVLLKNEKETLPLTEEDVVAVFGRCARDYFTVGYGSGGDVVSPYRANLMLGLKDDGVKVYRDLEEMYETWCANPRNVPDQGYWGHWPMSYPEMKISDETVKKASAVCSKAIVVIGRAAGESRENILKKGSFYLTNAEIRLLEQVTGSFDKVCVVLDCGNIIDMSWVEIFGDKISSIVYAWQGGMESGYALADVLCGKVNPSARLTDTIALNYEDYPTHDHFGGKYFNEYVEDIYVGYRYFETFAKDKVLYPFGFGLSYTTFDIEADGYEACEDPHKALIKVTVTNTGKVSGREVVQLYVKKPQGELGQPERVLAGFKKTRELLPGESEELLLEVDLCKAASYDDSGATGHKSCYVLEEGEYGIFVGADVRSAKEAASLEIEETEVIKELSERMAVECENVFLRMENKDGILVYNTVPVMTNDLKAEILSKLPKELDKYEGEDFDFSEVLAGNHTVEEFVSLLTKEELDEISHGQGKMNYADGPAGNAGAFAGTNEGLKKRGVPAIITTDGPSGIRLRSTCSLLPCGTALASSFDPESVEALYSILSREMTAQKTDMLLAPGMNIHRDPLCGRNFEYYSEDPFLTGSMAIAAVKGIQSDHHSACPKHFCGNNQETNRNKHDSRVSERALREIYLKGFEMVVTEADPLCLMSSYNKVNGVWSHYNYDLITGILREEWGFKGLIITDWWMQEGASREFPNITNDALRLRAQVDVLMPGEVRNMTTLESFEDPEGVTVAEAQRTAVNVLNLVVRLKK